MFQSFTWPRPYLRGNKRKLSEDQATRLRALVAAVGRRELEEGSRWVPLYPADVPAGNPCVPDLVYQLAPRPSPQRVLALCEGQRFVRLMTHPADARAGWHFPAGTLKFSFEALSPLLGEARFDCLHWSLAGWRPPWAQWRIIEQVNFEAEAVLRAPEPRPMVHGLWAQVYDGRCRSDLATTRWWRAAWEPLLLEVGDVMSYLQVEDVLDVYLGIESSQSLLAAVLRDAEWADK